MSKGDTTVKLELNQSINSKQNIISNMVLSMPPPIPLIVTDDWDIYESRIKQFFIAYGVDNNRKAAILMTALSSEAFVVLTNVCFPDGPDKKTLEELCKIN